MSRLQSFLFVSTYYVNNFKPFNSHVKEEVHNVPLQMAGRHRLAAHPCHNLLFCLPRHTSTIHTMNKSWQSLLRGA